MLVVLNESKFLYESWKQSQNPKLIDERLRGSPQNVLQSNQAWCGQTTPETLRAFVWKAHANDLNQIYTMCAHA